MDSAVTYKLPQFEGPLELLLHLIARNKVEITDIPVALICEQYMDTLAQMQRLDMEIASSFIVMAAQLIYIKSKTLLPAVDSDEPEEDPRAELVETLLAYQQFKAAAKEFEPRVRLGLERITRGQVLPSVTSPTPQYRHKPDDLLRALRLMREREERRMLPRTEQFQELLIHKPVPVEKKVRFLMSRLLEAGSLQFGELVKKSKSRSDMVALFLAVLELLGDQRIHLGSYGTSLDEGELILGGDLANYDTEEESADGHRPARTGTKP